jgi:hypothetical protein
MEHSWGEEEYTEWCNKNGRKGAAWMKAGIWRVRGIKTGTDKGSFLLCVENEDINHPLLRFPQTNLEIRNFTQKWLNMNEELVHRRIINCTNRTDIRKVEKYLDRIKRKWKNKIGINNEL